MISERKERNILLLSFFAGLIFAVVEIIFAIYLHSQSVLMDGVYDATELIFIALTLFLTPLFRKPISEKYPYGFYQVESIYIVIKGFMMLSVSFGVSIDVIQSLIGGGHMVNEIQVSLFQLILGIISFFIYLVMKNWNKKASSPTVEAEIIGWRIDWSYSLGLSLAFFLSSFLNKTPLKDFAPYIDSIIAILIMLMMLPENIKMLKDSIKDVFLFSPDKDLFKEIKEQCGEVLNKENIAIKFVDIIRTGRHTWVSIYYSPSFNLIEVSKVKELTSKCRDIVDELTEGCTVELILAPQKE